VKNETAVSARAVGAGDRFFLTDLTDKGKKKLNDMERERNKKEDRATKLSDKLRDQLRKLGRDV